MADAKLSTQLDWVSHHVKDFPLSGPLQLEAWQVLGQRLFNIAGDGDVKASGPLSTQGTIMAAIKGSLLNVGHYTALEVDSLEPSAPQNPYMALRSTHTL